MKTVVITANFEDCGSEFIACCVEKLKAMGASVTCTMPSPGCDFISSYCPAPQAMTAEPATKEENPVGDVAPPAFPTEVPQPEVAPEEPITTANINLDPPPVMNDPSVIAHSPDEPLVTGPSDYKNATILNLSTVANIPSIIDDLRTTSALRVPSFQAVDGQVVLNYCGMTMIFPDVHNGKLRALVAFDDLTKPYPCIIDLEQGEEMLVIGQDLIGALNLEPNRANVPAE